MRGVCDSYNGCTCLCEELDLEAHCSPYSIVSCIHVVANGQHNLPRERGRERERRENDHTDMVV